MKNLLGVVLVLCALLVYGSLFVVGEGTRAIKITFGKVAANEDGSATVFEPGLHWKIPIFDRIQPLDARIQTLDERADRFVTSEKEDLIVDSYVKWKIEDFGRYYLSTGGNKLQAETLLKQKVNNGLRSEFGTRTIQQIVSGERSELMDSAMSQASGSSDELGIRIIELLISIGKLICLTRTSIMRIPSSSELPDA
jgi:membrane protease subunit HflC